MLGEGVIFRRCRGSQRGSGHKFTPAGRDFLTCSAWEGYQEICLRNIPLISVRRDSHIVQLLFFSRVPLAGLFPTSPFCCFSFKSVSELICPRSWKTSAGGRTISCHALFHQDNLSAWISESDSNETFKDKPFLGSLEIIFATLFPSLQL